MSTFKGFVSLNDQPAGGTVLGGAVVYSAKVVGFTSAPETNVRELSATVGDNQKKSALGSDSVPSTIKFRLKNSDVMTFTKLWQQRLPVTVIFTPTNAPAAPDPDNPRTTIVMLWPKAPTMEADPDKDIEYELQILADSYKLEDGTDTINVP